MLKRSKRGALVYAQEERTNTAKLAAILAGVALIAFMALFGLPGDPLHGASKYQPKTCAGALECIQEGGR